MLRHDQPRQVHDEVEHHLRRRRVHLTGCVSALAQLFLKEIDPLVEQAPLARARRADGGLEGLLQGGLWRVDHNLRILVHAPAPAKRLHEQMHARPLVAQCLRLRLRACEPALQLLTQNHEPALASPEQHDGRLRHRAGQRPLVLAKAAAAAWYCRVQRHCRRIGEVGYLSSRLCEYLTRLRERTLEAQARWLVRRTPRAQRGGDLCLGRLLQRLGR